MKTKFIYILVFIFTMIGFTACTEDNSINNFDPIIGLGGEDYPENDIDRWLFKEFMQPYNVGVKYRWNPWEADLTSLLTPVKEDKVIPIMTLIRDVWIEPYKAITGVKFVKNYAPKNYVLIGSPKYNSNGTISLGEAEGGNKVTLYRLNWWDPTDHTNVDPDKRFENLVARILKTTHHEFTHILNQNFRYPDEFMHITPYESTWTNLTDVQARDRGFISPYASDASSEDFAEMVSMILVYGKPWFDARVAAAPITKMEGSDYNAQQALKLKETIMVAYMKETWNIEFYGTPEEPGLHELVQAAYKNFMSKFE